MASDSWSVIVSHAVLEMLVDPYGNRLVAGRHPTDPDQRVRYLVEVCDPCQTVCYPVNGWKVSDFCTPRFFDPAENPAVFYSFTGALVRPLQVIDGGYIIWMDPRDSGAYQLEGGADEPVLLADVTSLARTSAPLRTVVDTNPATPCLSAEATRVATSATDRARSRRALRSAAQATALTTAEAVLCAEAESWE
jgi:hypothetical protein